MNRALGRVRLADRREGAWCLILPELEDLQSLAGEIQVLLKRLNELACLIISNTGWGETGSAESSDP